MVGSYAMGWRANQTVSDTLACGSDVAFSGLPSMIMSSAATYAPIALATILYCAAVNGCQAGGVAASFIRRIGCVRPRSRRMQQRSEASRGRA